MFERELKQQQSIPLNAQPLTSGKSTTSAQALNSRKAAPSNAKASTKANSQQASTHDKQIGA